MARAYGANASLLAAFESIYGTVPTGDYWKLPFVSTSLGSEQGLIANDLIGLGRDPSAPIRDVIKVEGARRTLGPVGHATLVPVDHAILVPEADGIARPFVDDSNTPPC